MGDLLKPAIILKRIAAALMFLIAIVLIAIGSYVREMHPLQLQGHETPEQRKFIVEEDARRKSALLRKRLMIFTLAAVDLSAAILLLTWRRPAQ